MSKLTQALMSLNEHFAEAEQKDLAILRIEKRLQDMDESPEIITSLREELDQAHAEIHSMEQSLEAYKEHIDFLQQELTIYKFEAEILEYPDREI